MGENLVCEFFFNDGEQNREILFSKALTCAKYGKVLYLLSEELKELPQLSQDLNSVDKQYLKMLIFVYATNLESLVESVVSLPTWKNIPSTIIVDDLSEYCTQDHFQNICGVCALFVDTARSCAKLTGSCRLYIASKHHIYDEENCILLKELFEKIGSNSKEKTYTCNPILHVAGSTT